MSNQQVSIAFGSDLHLRRAGIQRSSKALGFPESADVIVLAGDIADGMHTAMIAFELADRHPTAHIIWVAGNHEFYNTVIDDQLQRFREACNDHDRVHFLENDSVEILGVTFLGCTLWTDFSILGEPELAMDAAGRCISDFSFITTRPTVTFIPMDAASRFKQSYAYLDEALAACDPDKTVVITHFPPGLETRNPSFPVDAITAYFQANVSFIRETYQPALWIYGHNHFSSDLQIGDTRVVSNQLGYESEDGRIPAYDASRLVYLDGGKGDIRS